MPAIDKGTGPRTQGDTSSASGASRYTHNRASTPAPPPEFGPCDLFLNAFVRVDRFRRDVPISVTDGAWLGLANQTDTEAPFRQRVVLSFFRKGMEHAARHASKSGVATHILSSGYMQVTPVFGTVEYSGSQSTIIVHVFFARSKDGHVPALLHYASIQLHPNVARNPVHPLYELCQDVSLGLDFNGDVEALVEKTPYMTFLLEQGQIPLDWQTPLRECMERNADRNIVLPIHTTRRAGSGLEDHDEHQGHTRGHGRLAEASTVAAARPKPADALARSDRSRRKRERDVPAIPKAYYRILQPKFEARQSSKPLSAEEFAAISESFPEKYKRGTHHNAWIKKYFDNKSVT